MGTVSNKPLIIIFSIEGGLKVPFAILGPQKYIPKNKIRDDLVCMLDLTTLPILVLNPKQNCQHSFQTYVVYVENRDKVMREMRAKGIEVQIGSYSLHMHNAFNNNSNVEIIGGLTNSKWCYDHALALDWLIIS